MESGKGFSQKQCNKKKKKILRFNGNGPNE